MQAKMSPSEQHDMKSVDGHRAVIRGLETRVRRPTDLTPSERQQLYALMRGHYETVDRDDFERDLNEKEWVVCSEDPVKGILGFSTLVHLSVRLQDELVTALFSGDTVLDPAIWGDSGSMRTWGRHVAKLAQQSNGSLFWLLLTATHRTYRFLPAFFKSYVPCRTEPTRPIDQQRIEALVRLKFPHEYNAQTGVVRLRKARPVRESRWALAMEGIDGKHAKFFAARNPGYLNGDYLVCLARLSPTNYTPLGRKFFAESEA